VLCLDGPYTTQSLSSLFSVLAVNQIRLVKLRFDIEGVTEFEPFEGFGQEFLKGIFRQFPSLQELCLDQDHNFRWPGDLVRNLRCSITKVFTYDMTVDPTQDQFAAAFSHANQLQSFISAFGPILSMSLLKTEGEASGNAYVGVLPAAKCISRACPTLKLMTLYALDGDVYGQGTSVNGVLDRFSYTGPFVSTLNGEPLRFWLPSEEMTVAPDWHTVCSFKICSCGALSSDDEDD
jgi:hypothetical protein